MASNRDVLPFGISAPVLLCVLAENRGSGGLINRNNVKIGRCAETQNERVGIRPDRTVGFARETSDGLHCC